MVNRSFKTQIRTAIRNFEIALKSGDQKQVDISSLYSVMDRAVKRGIFKQNKADRMKARAKAKADQLLS